MGLYPVTTGRELKFDRAPLPEKRHAGCRGPRGATVAGLGSSPADERDPAEEQAAWERLWPEALPDRVGSTRSR